MNKNTRLTATPLEDYRGGLAARGIDRDGPWALQIFSDMLSGCREPSPEEVVHAFGHMVTSQARRGALDVDRFNFLFLNIVCDGTCSAIFLAHPELMEVMRLVAKMPGGTDHTEALRAASAEEAPVAAVGNFVLLGALPRG